MSKRSSGTLGKVTGIGGIFFKANDPVKLKEWYIKHLGIAPDENGYIYFKWDKLPAKSKTAYTIWEPFKESTDYFNPSTKPFMINFTVDDLHELLAALKLAGVEVDEKTEESEYGKFGWIMDPEGNRIELWEPSAQ